MEIEIRTKTVETLKDISDDMISRIMPIIEDFISYPENKAFELILSMKTQKQESLKYLGLEDIGEENILKVRGDMAANYKKNHPDCWLNEAKENYPEYLRNALGDDITLLRLIKDKCIETSYLSAEELDRILFLTSHEEEKNRFGGLRAMHFSKQDTAFLKNFANQIGEYLKTFIDPEKLAYHIQVPKDVVFEEKLENEATCNKVEKVTENTSTSLTFKALINESDAIIAYIKAYKTLKKLGIDPLQISEDSFKCIEAIINMVKDLEKKLNIKLIL